MGNKNVFSLLNFMKKRDFKKDQETIKLLNQTNFEFQAKLQQDALNQLCYSRNRTCMSKRKTRNSKNQLSTIA